MHPAEFGNLAARYNLVEIAEACRREAKLSKLDGQNPASFQPVATENARLLARPILQEYDAFHSWGIENEIGKSVTCSQIH